MEKAASAWNCTGIVTCIWPTVDVIRRARELRANLIISHEARVRNDGDRRDVLAHNTAFQAKLRLLDEWGGTVWRCHDYIHAGIPLADGTCADGIFYGFAEKLGWTGFRVGDTFRCLDVRASHRDDCARVGATHREEAWALAVPGLLAMLRRPYVACAFPCTFWECPSMTPQR